MMREFRNELILARPSPSAQNLLFGSPVSVGRLLGYKGEHPYPHRGQSKVRAT
jgi:hypothetical protein